MDDLYALNDISATQQPLENAPHLSESRVGEYLGHQRMLWIQGWIRVRWR